MVDKIEFTLLYPKSILIIFSLLLFINCLKAQDWEKTWNDLPGSSLNAMVYTSDSSVIAVGTAGGNGLGLLVTKLNAEGEELWRKVYPDTLYKIGFFIVRLSSGYYAIVGNTKIIGRNHYGWILKIDEDGKTVNQNIFTNKLKNLDISGNAIATRDGGLLISQNSLLKISENGIIEWEKSYNDEQHVSCAGISITKEGGYILTGWVEDNSPEKVKSFLLKTDSNGNNEWMVFPKIKNTIASIGYDVIATQEGYVVLGINNTGFGGGVNLWKTDLNGNTLWYKNHKGNIATKIVLLNGRLAYTGMDLKGRVFLTITDNYGNEINHFNYSKNNKEFGLGNDILSDDKNGIHVAGFIQNEISNYAFLNFFRLD